jgi:hypothetical protein
VALVIESIRLLCWGEPVKLVLTGSARFPHKFGRIKTGFQTVILVLSVKILHRIANLVQKPHLTIQLFTDLALDGLHGRFTGQHSTTWQKKLPFHFTTAISPAMFVMTA